MALKDSVTALFAPERMPVFVGGVTLVAGAALTLKPDSAARALGIEGEETAVRMIGLADLVLVPGLFKANPRWPWMVARAALNVAQAAYLFRISGGSTSPGLVKGGATTLLALIVADGSTALKLYRIEAEIPR